MSDDIVTRLRRSTWRDCIEAADEIERLRRNTGCARNQRSTQFCAEALDAQRDVERLREQLRLANIDNFNTTAEVETLRAERDEARREVCAMSFDDQRRTAEERGWDCFKDKAACCSTPADGKHTSAGETKVCGLCDQPSDAVNGHGDCMNCAKDQYGA
jgi:hypothetical protein